jgi:hypothetical protein
MPALPFLSRPAACIALSVAFMLSMPKAIEVGSIWEVVANPIEDVEVSTNGRVEKGALTRTWGGDWLLLRSDGGVRRIEMGTSILSFQVGPFRSPARSWRLYIPVAGLVLTWALGFVILAARGMRARLTP